MLKKFLLLICVLTAIPTFAEDEFSIFSTSKDGIDFDILAKGFWFSNFRASTSVAFLKDGSKIFPYFIKGFDGIKFENEIDLSLAMWVYKKFFIKYTITPEFRKNQISLGFLGNVGPLFINALASNSNIKSRKYPFISQGDGVINSPGFDLFLKSSYAKNELMLRYEPSKKLDEKFKIGTLDSKIELRKYVRGVGFALPDYNINGELEIYLEDKDGVLASDLRKYKRVYPSSSEYAFDAENGILYFKKPVEGRVLIFYTKMGTPVGQHDGDREFYGISSSDLAPDENVKYLFSFSNQDFKTHYIDSLNSFYGGQTSFNENDFKVSIEGRDALLIFDKNFQTPFESRGFYENKNGNYKASLQGEHGFYKDIDLKFFGSYFTIQSNDFIYPLLKLLKEEEYSKIYGEGGEDSEIYISLLAESGQSSFELKENANPSSIEVYKNGRKTEEFNYENGFVKLKEAAIEGDEISIKYRTIGEDFNIGQLLFLTGNEFDLGQGFSLKIASALDFDVSKDLKYSTFDNDKKGTFTTSFGIEYRKDNFLAGLNLGLDYQNQNTTGVFRLLSMDGIKYKFNFSFRSLSPVVKINDKSIKELLYKMGVLDSFNLDKSGIGQLFFKDYSKDMQNFSFYSYDKEISLSKIFPYKEGSYIGPYIAEASDDTSPFDGQVMVMDYAMDLDEFVAGRINFLERKDLSDLDSISFYIKSEENESSYVFLEIGDLDENISGVGDENKFGYGSMFRDEKRGIDLIYDMYLKNNISSKDKDRNGTIDPGNTEFAATFFVGEIKGGDFKRVEINLTKEQKARLKNASAMDIVVLNGEKKKVLNRIIVGGINFSSKSYEGNFENGNISVYMAEDKQEKEELATLFAKENYILDGDFGPFLSVKWDSTSKGNMQVHMPFLGFDFKRARELSFFMKIKSLSDQNSDFIIDFTNGTKIIFEAKFQVPERFTWQKVELNFTNDKVFILGQEVGSIKKINENDDDIDGIYFKKEQTLGGMIYLDEFLIKDSMQDFAYKGQFYMNYKKAEVLKIGNFDVVSNLIFNENVLLGSPGYNRVAAPFANDSTLGFDIAYIRFSTKLNLLWNKNTLQKSLDFSFGFPYINDSPLLFRMGFYTNFEGNALKGFIETNLKIGPLQASYLNSNGILKERLEQKQKVNLNLDFKKYSINSEVNMRSYSIEKTENPIFAPIKYLVLSKNSLKRDFQFNLNQNLAFKNTSIFLNYGFKTGVISNINYAYNNEQLRFNTIFEFSKYKLYINYSRKTEIGFKSLENDFSHDLLRFGENKNKISLFYSPMFFIDAFYNFEFGRFIKESKDFNSMLFENRFLLKILSHSFHNFLDFIVPSGFIIEGESYIKKEFNSIYRNSKINLLLSHNTVNVFFKDDGASDLGLSLNFRDENLESFKLTHALRMNFQDLFLKKGAPRFWELTRLDGLTNLLAKKEGRSEIQEEDLTPFKLGIVNEFSLLKTIKDNFLKVSERIRFSLSYANDFTKLKKKNAALEFLINGHSYVLNVESLEFAYNKNMKYKTFDFYKNTEIEVLVSHSSYLVLSPLGYIKAALDFAFKIDPIDNLEDFKRAFGFKFSLSFKLIF